ncbi:hypothetical protein DRQ15_01360, partial [candidate division KSB1 bacterium]
PVNKKLSLLNIVEIYASSQLVNYASPGKLGVPAKAFLLKKIESVALTRSVPSLLSELFLDNIIMLSMLIGAAVLGGYLSVVVNMSKRYLFGNLTAVLILLVSSVLLGEILFLTFKNRNIPFLENFLSAVRISFQQRKYFTIASILTLAILLLSYFCDWLLLRSLGLIVSYSFVIMAFAFSTIVGFLSPLPGGVGVREVSNAYLFKIFYNAGEFAFFATFLRRVLDYLMVIILFLCVKVVRQKKWFVSHE